MNIKKIVCLLALTCIPAVSQAAVNLPAWPSSPNDPGSRYYPWKFSHQAVSVAGRSVDVYFPAGAPINGKVPVIVFGRGAGTQLAMYHTMLEHLAMKGIAVIFPEYKDGLGDHDSRRMAEDYAQLAAAVISQYSNVLDANAVIYSGHSMGARTALMAAGLPQNQRVIEPRAVVLFDTAGYDVEYLARLNPQTVFTLVVGDQDDKTPPSHSKDIYDRINAPKKQLIVMRSYLETSPQFIADHGFVRTLDWGGERVTPLHYLGSWKFLVGAAWDLQGYGGNAVEPHVYGAAAAGTGLPGANHSVLKSW